LARKVFQLCPRGARGARLGRYLDTVACATAMPSLRSSPWMRGAPQLGLAAASSRMSAIVFGSTAVAHFQGDVLIENVQCYIAGRELEPAFDGHANCFIETGFGKASA